MTSDEDRDRRPHNCSESSAVIHPIHDPDHHTPCSLPHGFQHNLHPPVHTLSSFILTRRFAISVLSLPGLGSSVIYLPVSIFATISVSVPASTILGRRYEHKPHHGCMRITCPGCVRSMYTVCIESASVSYSAG
ncbi:hypothetical protein E1B28_010826 [Marasmius oreades]|uniref:Uncharacterized protein n=1 Tax=Marasmius oreades TaxID=181124 RepID=A0A9P7UPC7_9AGAR|nr:uncharacterized protein E1B28_010826 [Marasmius oreades]KAG7089118.1 hypothetical protein E1B28_010826 [Marasmius oreades]